MKTGARNSAGQGLEYRGTMTFRRSAQGALTFESVPFVAGRMTGDGVRYYVTDHLGSVRAVLDGDTGNLLEASDYSAFGTRRQPQLPSLLTNQLNNSTPSMPFRHHFTGQEEQVGITSSLSLPYTDFGARHYSPTLSRWLVPDPMNEKYYDVSPYAYCANDPVNLVDPNGMDMDDFHFDKSGKFLFREETNLPHRIIVGEGEDALIVSFVDPVNDVDIVESSRLAFPSDSEISSIIDLSGATSKENHGLRKGMKYLLAQSNNSEILDPNQFAKLDFSGSGQYGIDTNEHVLYITNTNKEGYVAHNPSNYGNFLWGAAAQSLGVPLIVARFGAHWHNFFIDKHYIGTLDSKDDQNSIKIGYHWSKEQRE